MEVWRCGGAEGQVYTYVARSQLLVRPIGIVDGGGPLALDLARPARLAAYVQRQSDRCPPPPPQPPPGSVCVRTHSAASETVSAPLLSPQTGLPCSWSPLHD